MKATTVSLVLLLAPAALIAQASGQAGGATPAKTSGASAAADVSASANSEYRVPAGFSAKGKAELDEMFAEAKEHRVPREPMAHRVAEGHAKGASETTIIASTGKVKANLEATQEAMIAGNRMHPSDEEIERGESAMERGVTKAQIQAIAQSTQGDRSLVVAFDVLAKLAVKGVPVGQAVAQVQSNVSKGASDAALTALVTATVNANASNAAANANGNAAAKGVGGTLTTTIGGVLKKP